MPNYKLTYFSAKELAEPIRYLFSYGDIEFVDERLSEDEWLQIKLGNSILIDRKC